MKINGKTYRTIWPIEGGDAVEIIDQTQLPHDLVILRLNTVEHAVNAIFSMKVRGAPLIGATGAYGLWLALKDDPSDVNLDSSYEKLLASRPTAVNLCWALDRVRNAVRSTNESNRAEIALSESNAIAEEDVLACQEIGKNGLNVLRDISKQKEGEILNVLTHCNAGWLATVDYGTALSPVYAAHDTGIPIHVWVDETRPRNQGSALTAWELGKHGVAHTVIADNTGGHLMQNGQVDICITGTDRTAANGDVCNKIGTYLKALAAYDNGVPFYVALPYSTIDWNINSGFTDIPIEEREISEVTHISGLSDSGEIISVQLTPKGSLAANYAFDVTPARLITGLITERGLCSASEEGLLGLYPEHKGP